MLRSLREKRPEGQERVFLYSPGKGKARPMKQPHGAWKTAFERAKLEDVTMHDLRHTFASRLVMKNVPLLTVSRLLGHSDIKMTMRYSHLSQAHLKEAVAVLDKLGIDTKLTQNPTEKQKADSPRQPLVIPL